MIYNLMKTRRSVRRFRPEAPGREILERLIEAAVTAPSASNKQPWRFLIVTSREVIGRLAAAVREATDRIASHVEEDCREGFVAYGDYFSRFESAPVVIVPLYRDLTLLSNMIDDGIGREDRERISLMETNSGIIGAALAMQNLLLMAHSLGLGASGMTGPLVALGRLREILEVPGSWQVAAFIPVGFPGETPPPTPRKPIDKVIRWIR